jgi:hypothetical protein
LTKVVNFVAQEIKKKEDKELKLKQFVEQADSISTEDTEKAHKI